jgi:hypothetical protein
MWVAWALLSSSSGSATGVSSAVLARPKRTEATAPVTASPTGGDDGEVPQDGRDPFGDEDPAVSTGRATPPHAQPTPTPAAPTSAPTSRPEADGTPTGSSTATVTVTVAPTYVGLYAWNGSRASFRVNARTYSVAVGAGFGPGLRFTAVVQGTPRCARVQHGPDSLTLCPGQVTTLP